MLKDLYDFKNELVNRGLFFCFCGPLTQDLVKEIGSTLEQKMKIYEADKSTVLRVFAVVIETAQNIMYYSAEKYPNNFTNLKHEEIGFGIITVGFCDNHYYVVSGNLVRNEDVPRLRDKLEKLASLDKNDLKKLFKDQLKKGPEKGSKGAGLGFIEMAKKSCKPIEFSFREIDMIHSFFSIKISISN